MEKVDIRATIAKIPPFKGQTKPKQEQVAHAD